MADYLSRLPLLLLTSPCLFSDVRTCSLLPCTGFVDQVLVNGCPVVQPIDAMIYRWLNANPEAACKEIEESMSGGGASLAEEAESNGWSAVFSIIAGQSRPRGIHYEPGRSIYLSYPPAV